jgi:hypothetical protein
MQIQLRRTFGNIGLTLLLGALGGFFPTKATATSVVPPEFDALVGQADYIVRAVVKSVSAEWRVTDSQRSIITKVELEVREVIAGTPPQPLILELLGGKIGEEELVVHGVPRFSVGQEDILFIRGNGVQFCPVVALMHGRYPLRRDQTTGREFVARSNGEPLYSEQDVARPLRERPARAQPLSAQALSAADFTVKIRASYQNTHRVRAN